MKPFEGVPERDPGHSGTMLFEEQDQTGRIHLSGLPEHPSAGLVDQVLAVRKQLFGQAEGRIDVPLADEPPGRDDGDPSIPQAPGSGKVEQNPAVLVLEKFSNYIGGALVHQVPFGHPLAMVDVKMENPFLAGGVSAIELVSQDPEPQGADFMHRGCEAFPDLIKAQMGKRPGHRTHVNFSDAPKDMAIRIAVEPFLDRNPGGIGAFPESGQKIRKGHRR